MMEGFYSLGPLRAKPGKEGELLAAWQALCDGFAQLDHPPVGNVTLVQSTTEPSLHYSFAPWRTLEDFQAMRSDPRLQEGFRKLADCCTEFIPGVHRVVGKSTYGPMEDEHGNRAVNR
jgi:hypothetical protein